MLGVGAIGGRAITIALPLADANPSAALGAGIGAFSALLLFALGYLVAGRNDDTWGAGDRRLLAASAVCSGMGVLVCFIGLSLGIESWQFVVAGLLALGSVGVLAAVARRRVADPQSGRLAEWL